MNVEAPDVDHCKLSSHLFGGFYDCDETNKEAEKYLRILTAKYGTPECGRNRATFMSKHCVIKFPLNDNGIYSINK